LETENPSTKQLKGFLVDMARVAPISQKSRKILTDGDEGNVARSWPLVITLCNDKKKAADWPLLNLSNFQQSFIARA
jgi:hypothetical protein